MRLAVFIVAALHSVVAGADSHATESPDWVQRAVDLGLQSAYVILEYSLTDNCDLAPVRVVERSSEELFDTDVVDQIVRTQIGPFEGETRDEIGSGLVPTEDNEEHSKTTRIFYWSTDLGHRFIVCQLYGDGEFASAWYVDGNRAPSNSVEDRPVARRLSKLGTRTLKSAFKLED